MDGSSDNGMDNCKVWQQSVGFLGYKSALKEGPKPSTHKTGRILEEDKIQREY